MKIKLHKYWPLIIIILIASVIRIWKLGTIPPHLTSDEAALGYNAYSILKTGRDEHGKLLPIIFQSFGDYKPGLYIYSTVPSVAILGLNEFSVRLPSAIAGVICVFLLYLLTKKLFQNLPSHTANKIAFISSLMLAISPWHIHFSRGAWEINLALTLSLAGVLFFLYSLKNSKYLIVSAIFFALTLLTYQGAKISTLIIIMILGLVYFQKVIKFSKKIILSSIFLGFIISVPILLSIINGTSGRIKVFSVFSYPRPKEYLENQLKQGNEIKGDLSYYLFHSESLSFAKAVTSHWFNHFSPRFLFFEGDWSNPRHSAPNSGMLIFTDMVLLFVGVIALIKLKDSKKQKIFIFFWLMLAPMSGSLTRDVVHAVRSYNMVIPLAILEGIGVYSLLELLKNLPAQAGKKILFLFLGICLYFLNYIYFLDAYFIHLPVHNAKYWEYGYKQLVETITPIQNNYQQIIIPQSFDQPYIYFLFFQKYDPHKYQKNSSTVEINPNDVGIVENLDNIKFLNMDWPRDQKKHGALVIGNEEQIPRDDLMKSDSYNILKEIKYPDNLYIAFRLIEIK